MNTEELQKLLCTKIGMELKSFKRKILRLEPEEIYQRAYQIDSMINIYELLMEQSQKIREDILQVLLVVPGLLAFFYRRWQKKEDSSMEELLECVNENVLELSRAFSEAVQEEKGRAA